MPATILQNTEIARGMRWLKLHLPDGTSDCEPGTVLGLRFSSAAGSFRHPYTVSRADAKAQTLEFLYRVIPEGHMTPQLAALEPGAEITIAGRGGHAITGEVATDPQGIVLVSTGAGIGPCFGYAELALKQGLTLPLTLVAGFREEADACLQAELAALAAAHANFKWQFSLSKPSAAWQGPRGRVTESLPGLLGPIGDLHFHLVGNGEMVVELYQTLMLVGLKDERVTSEIYFNWADDLDEGMLKAKSGRYEF